MVAFIFVVVFFFKQKTAYEMRISDWSSDVCSSDLAPKEVGTIGVVSQSGGLSTDIIKRGQWRGLRFSGLVTIGNSADVEPHELLEYYFDDPQTGAVGLYLEDVKSGRAFFDLLRSPKATKPVVILKGGLSSHGRTAAASHTGPPAGDARAWRADRKSGG